MEEMFKLKAPPGRTSVSSGVGTFQIVDGFVTVPESVAKELLKPFHGFVRVPIYEKGTLHLKKHGNA